MKLEIDKKLDLEDVKRITITTDKGVEFRLNICHLTGGLIINKFDDDSAIYIIPRVSNEILLK